MWLCKVIQNQTTAELEEMLPKLNLTDEEKEIIKCMQKGYSNVQIATDCNISLATLGNRIKGIRKKIERVMPYE